MIDSQTLTDLAGSGSYDGRQEHARRLLLARLTSDRADELCRDAPPGSPQADYRAAAAMEEAQALEAFSRVFE